jgi:hypothetical protein
MAKLLKSAVRNESNSQNLWGHIVIAVSVALTLTSLATAATQVTKQGITWTFDKDYQVGQYVNGDYWVLASGGTVKVNSVSPSPAGSGSTYRNGSMLNPMGGSAQGYDGRIDGYTSSKSIVFPVTISAGGSLVSSESRTATAATLDVFGASCNPEHNFLQRAAVLTVVSAVPASTSFRPPYSGTSKPVYLTTQVNRALLPRVPLSTKPSLATLTTVAGYFQNVWLDHKVSWTGRMMHPISNMPGYGRDIGDAVSRGACLLMLDYTDAQIEPLLINYIQLGIDLYGISQNGGTWPADGGHENGRKWPILFAGIMLNNSQMKAVNVDFGEDDQTYYGVTRSANAGQTYVAWFGRDCVSAYQSNGCTGAGTKDCRAATHDRDACQDYRNCCTSYTWVGEALAAELMNAEGIWNHPAFFDYVDRWMGYGKDPVVGSGDWIQPGAAGATFVADMWRQYRPLVGGTTPTNSRPTANAGPDQTVLDSDNSGSQAVTLDGSGSTDSDGTISSYSWAEGSTAIATGQKPSVNLSVGQHTIVLTVTDNGGLTSQDTVVITVTSPATDVVPPTVLSVNCVGNSVEVLFSEPLNVASAQTITNYAINKGITVTQAAYQGTANKVVLTTSAAAELETYNLTVSNVRDSAGNTIVTAATPFTYSPGLVGYWEFGATSGTSAQDSSGQRNNGSLVNGPTWTGNGQISFVGPGQAVQIPTKGWNPSAGTITLHAQVSSTSGDQYLLGHTVGTWTNRLQLFTENGSLCLGIGDRHLVVTGAAPMTSSTWYDIALTWDGSRYSLYLDGTPVASGTYTGLTAISTYADIANDGYSSSRTEGMTGLVQNTRVYNRALSTAEIGTIYNRDRSYLFAPIGNKTVDAGSTLTFSVVPVNPSVVVSLSASTLPTAPSFSANTFTWTPASGTSGVYSATFAATYGALSDSETISITVNGLNRAPVLSGLSNRTINENQRMTFTVTASDPDGQTPTVAAANLPRGAVFTNGVFDWTPGSDQAGVYTVQFTASDGQLTSTGSVTITVLDVADTGSVVIIDNGSANTSYTGTWAPSGAASAYGADSVWSRDGDTYTWTFRPSVSGSYKLEMWWTTWPSRSNAIPVTIQNAAGAATVTINQLTNGNIWNSLGSFSFVAGSSYNITIKSQPGPSSTCADAVRLTYVNPTVPSATIIDNKDAATARTGTWASSGATGFYGTDSVWSRDGDKFTWYFTPSQTGQYQVAMWWTTWPSRAANIPVSISNASGSAVVYVNQQQNGGIWNTLGSYTFNAGTRYAVTMTSMPDPASTCADALKFTFVQ